MITVCFVILSKQQAASLFMNPHSNNPLDVIFQQFDIGVNNQVMLQ